MFYEPRKGDHGLAHDPFKALVVPRPIGWISSLSADGAVNLAPYSFFNAFQARPHLVGFASDGRKDSVVFVEETREFVCNLVTEDLWRSMSATSAPLPRGDSEMAHAALEAAPSRLVRPPRVARAAAALECRWTETIHLRDADGRPSEAYLVCGEVVGIFVDDRFIAGGRVDTAAMRVMSRLGYQDYGVVERALTLTRPAGGGDAAAPSGRPYPPA
ncbi:flavin reductase family protein [Labrys wisconsinensis]|uniref:Flavin reductase (DIM6/NTAB) family NADH-FMN oxidoreductase RutF n=1 Tax=Labrys wisconsinensis TaxID=425677 RepID=A0ABU0JER5_9HYPH|nr:flavin reductase family protein [Labrys wisconsinensis]MDQ0472761.1 flavin reductase (DIM6/NTAB) family NADH-FMN oxidoreductase RutF [Labrys wisconsinensis]